MFIAIVGICVCLFLAARGMTDEERRAVKTPPEPTVFSWLTTDTIKTIGEVTAVEGLPMGRVIVERGSDKNWYSAAVVPLRKIPVGSEVKICEVHWPTSSSQQFGPGFALLLLCGTT